MLSKAYDAAQAIIQNSSNAQEALKKAGVNVGDFKTAKNLLNHPLASCLISALGGSKEEILKGVNTAETMVTPQNFGLQAEQAPVSELDRLRQNLSRIK